MTRSRSPCVKPRTKVRRRGSNSPQRSPRLATSEYCVVSGSEDGERPWKRSSQSHSAPKMCASVSRTEEKLEHIGLVNCSGVSAAAALSERRLAQALYSYSRRISSGDIELPHKRYLVTISCFRDLANGNTNWIVCLRRRTRMIGLAVRRESAAADEDRRSEEHTSELQSHLNLVCRLLLEKKTTH